MRMASVYESITQQIIADLERGTPAWLKPWKNGDAGALMPTNAVTGRLYSGVNIPILWVSADAQGFPRHRWLTYRQAQEQRANVRKGEKGTTVVFAKRLTVTDGAEEERQIAMLRAFTVFNTAQVDGLPQPEPTSPAAAPTHTAAVLLIEATEADIRIGGDRAYYSHERDYVGVPPASAFNTEGSYLATVLHELVHNAVTRIMPHGAKKAPLAV